MLKIRDNLGGHTDEEITGINSRRRSGSVENVTFDFRGKLEFQQLKSDWGVDKQVKSRLRLYLVGWVEEPRYSFDERQLR